MSSEIKDMSGQRIGALTATHIKKIDGKSQWLCKCDCGNYCYYTGYNLRQLQKKNRFPTCGCARILFNGQQRTLVGVKTSLITVCSYNKNKDLYLCINKSGKEEWLNADCIRLRIYHSKNHDKIIRQKQDIIKEYGYSDIDEYNKDSVRLHHILIIMRERCYNKSHDKYRYYGGKGVTIYDEWLQNPKEFVHWAMLNGYSKGLQIDRIDNNKGYYPENCRWVTRTQNMNNRSNNFYITLYGKTQSLADWCREYNLNYKKTHALIRYKGKTLTDIIEESRT